MVFVIIGALSLYIIYQFLAFYQILGIPLISIAIDNNFIIIIRAVAYKWSLVDGILGLFYAIAGYIAFRQDTSKGTKIGLALFYLVYIFILTI